ncbi:MAG: SDR family NAD(P)-dependent oxidoreductase [Dehalococcoidales bacterium]
MEIFDLSGRIAIVTGGNRGIGLSIAKGLASAGATIIIVNRRAAEGQSAAESLKKEGLNAVSIPTDVTSTSSIAKMVSKVISDFGKIDILVNNAGIVIRKPAEEFSEEDWDRIMDTNLKGVFFCCQTVGREMIKNKKGKIINVSSNISARVQPIRAAYATSKAGLNHLTRSLAYEWAKYNVNVNALAPTVTITDMNKKYFLEEHPEELETYVGLTPKGRVAYPEDYVGAAIFLASDASNYITGQILYVDGGITL